MFLFIGESIGWQELFLIGVLALIFLGPRKLPQIAKTIGKTLSELKSAGQEFRSTWEREVSLQEDEKNFLKNPLEEENLILAEEKHREPIPINGNKIPAPEVRQIAPTDFPSPATAATLTSANKEIPTEKPSVAATSAADAPGKQDWL